MNGVFDTYLTENKWLLNAEKAKTDEDRIKFCKAYLRHKGINIEPMPAPFMSEPPKVQYTNKKSKKVYCERRIDYHMWETLSPASKIEFEAGLRVDIAKEIGVELVKSQHMKFETMTKYDTFQKIILGTVEVVE